MLNINNWIQDSIVDGEGLRFVVFLQGCPHNCKGCHNPEGIPFVDKKLVSTGELLVEMRSNPLIDGVTLSGGEPFAQAKDLIEFARAVTEDGLNLWIYTGYLWEDLLASHDEKGQLLELADVLVDGLFVLEERTLSLSFRGSKNQRIIDVKKSFSTREIVLWKEEIF